MAQAKPKFKVGQVVAAIKSVPGFVAEGELLRIGWRERGKVGWLYRTTRWASMGYFEHYFRPLTKREIGA